MRYIKIPESVKLSIVRNVDGKQERKEIEYSFQDLNAQLAWPHERWREDQSKHNALMRIFRKVSEVKPGDVMALEDADYELWAPIVTMKGQKLRDDLAIEMNLLMNPIFNAGHEPPEELSIEAEPSS